MAIRKPRVGDRWFVTNYFRGWNVFEIAFFIAALVVPLAIGIPLGSSALEIASSSATLITAILFSKGKLEGYFLALVAMTLYTIVAFRVELFGEMIIQVAIVFPITIFGFVTWARFRNKDKGDTVLVGYVGKREFIIIISTQLVMLIGYYFLLEAFNTRFAALGAISIATAVVGNYLIARRCQFGPGVFIPSDIALIVLWSLVIADGGGAGAIVKLVMPIMFLINDIYGIFEWRRLKREQVKNKVTCDPDIFDPCFH
ncbi:MAG: nicotinamide riboside transporter PnuC [Firmicutes bacterium]|nr:nicotinamide riboside transporter PnuC [Bacillota bacterium]